jgi:carbon-monoxide dehydrogenase large subunit
MCERVVDLIAAELALDPVEVRRRNFISPDEFPYRTATGANYDSGDYERALDAALQLVDYDGLRRDQARRRASDHHDAKLLGIGIACYVEVSGQGSEFGSVKVEGDGTVTVVTGSVPHGQGHETVWAQIASSVLGVAVDDVRVLHSDTSIVARGPGTFGSRSLQLAGSAVLNAAGEVLAKARPLVADLLEANPDDIVAFPGGGLGVAGTPSSVMSWAEIAANANDGGAASGVVDLSAELDFEQRGSYPFGTHVAVVEVDPDTGRVELTRIVAVDDCGTVINPKLAEGQVHGGLAQGIAQCLFEEVVYDGDGNPLTSTLADYLMPSAADMPSFETAHTETPSPRNPLGAKGIGESGTTGSIAAVWNAVVDALAPFGVRHLDPPFSPERVWRAMNGN